MRHILLQAIGAVGLLTLATAAAAQFAPRLPPPAAMPSAYRPTTLSPAPSVHQLRRSATDGVRSGQLSRDDARHLKREARQIDTLAARYSEGGTSDAEQHELDTRALVLQDQIDAKRTQGMSTPKK